MPINTPWEQLRTKNKAFFIALHFCDRQKREQIAALVGFFHDCMGLFKRIKEPLAIQMRLTWWRTQFDSDVALQTLPAEIKLLKEYPMGELLEIIENEYIHKDPLYAGKSGFMLYKIIGDMWGFPDESASLGAYGTCYAELFFKKKTVIPSHKLPFSLRFLRIPIILEQNHKSFLHLFYYFVKNFLI